MNELKNCPFCGCRVQIERRPLEHYRGCYIFEIECSKCGCKRTLTRNDSVYRTEEEARANAIAQWNMRASKDSIGLDDPEWLDKPMWPSWDD